MARYSVIRYKIASNAAYRADLALPVSKKRGKLGCSEIRQKLMRFCEYWTAWRPDTYQIKVKKNK